MIIVPQIVVYKLISGLLESVRKNFAMSANDPESSFLYQTFNGLKAADLDYYSQAKEFFNRTKAHPKHLDTRFMFDKDRALHPTIHVTMGEDMTDILGIGANQTINDSGQLENTTIDAFKINLLFTSDNKNEITLMYELVKAFLPALSICFEANGLLNVKRHGRDLTIDQSEIPTHMYMRVMTLHGKVEQKSPAREELLSIAGDINVSAQIVEIC
jgi:hypothetical protein